MCAYLRLDSIKENIEGDANLHHPPVIGLRAVLLPYFQRGLIFGGAYIRREICVSD